MPQIALINPNTSTATTDRMLAIAREHAPRDLVVMGLTAPFGAALITDDRQLATARRAVAAMLPGLRGRWVGLIVSAFGDPGLEELRDALSVPVAGIGEAGLLEASQGRRRFAIVTTTPDLVPSINAKAERLGCAESYAGVVLTSGDPVALTADALRLEAALHAAIEEAIFGLRAEAVLIGGGPLAAAARGLAPRFRVPLVEPIPAAVRWLQRELATRE
jgi:allantoin racemase